VISYLEKVNISHEQAIYTDYQHSNHNCE